MCADSSNVNNQKQAEPSSKEGGNVIRVKASGQMKAYIDYAKRYLDDPSCESVRVVAVGQAISKAISVAEILKRQYQTLDQHNSLVRFRPDPSAAPNPNPNPNPAASNRRITSCLTIDLKLNRHNEVKLSNEPVKIEPKLDTKLEIQA